MLEETEVANALEARIRKPLTTQYAYRSAIKVINAGLLKLTRYAKVNSKGHEVYTET